MNTKRSVKRSQLEDTKVAMSAKIMSVMAKTVTATTTATIVVTAESKTEGVHGAAAGKGHGKNRDILSEMVDQAEIVVEGQVQESDVAHGAEVAADRSSILLNGCGTAFHQTLVHYKTLHLFFVYCFN